MKIPLRRTPRTGSPAEAPPLVRLWRYARGHRRTVVAAISFSVVNKLADVMPELLIGAAVDVVVRAEDSLVATVFGVEDRFDQLVVLAVINVVVWLVESGSEYVSNLLWRNLAQTIEHEARMDAYRHVQRLELAWFEDQSTGGLMAVLNDDVNQLERFLDMGASEIIRTLVNVVFVGVVFFVAEPILGVVAFLPIPLIVWASVRYQTRLEPHYAAVRGRAGDLGALLANNLSGIATIRSFTAESRETARVADASQAYREANRGAIKLSSAFIPLIRMAILAAFTVTLLVGGRAALNGTMDVGLFSVLVYMTQRLLWPLTRLGETFDLYQRAMASTRRILDLLAVDPTIVDGPGALAEPISGEVRFDRVSFAYGPPESRGAAVLDEFSLEVPAGETHAIVGATGAGKSTVVKLLLRLYDVTGGRITLDGVGVESVPLAAVRRSIGYVGQDVFLFQGTVRENLAYGRPDATDEELEQAARLAEAHEFIQGLRTATARSSGSGARSCPAASASGCRSPGPSSRTRPCWCWTRPPPPSTTRPRPPSSALWSWWARVGPWSSSPTGCRPCATPTASTCWSGGGWWSRAPTTSCWRSGGCTPPCGASRRGRCTPCRSPTPRELSVILSPILWFRSASVCSNPCWSHPE
jgi:ATP-binding cassette subfamily B protein